MVSVNNDQVNTNSNKKNSTWSETWYKFQSLASQFADGELLLSQKYLAFRTLSYSFLGSKFKSHSIVVACGNKLRYKIHRKHECLKQKKMNIFYKGSVDVTVDPSMVKNQVYKEFANPRLKQFKHMLGKVYVL